MKRKNRPILSWFQKFVVAFRGIYLAARYERSCWVHLTLTIVMMVAGLFLRISIIEWALLTLSAAMVWTAELINTAIERLCEVDHPHPNPRIAALLDIAAGGVLIAAMGASIVGGLVFLPRIVSLFSTT